MYYSRASAGSPRFLARFWCRRLRKQGKPWGGQPGGPLKLVATGEDLVRADMEMAMGASDVRGAVLRSDVLWVATVSTATACMAAWKRTPTGCGWFWRAHGLSASVTAVCSRQRSIWDCGVTVVMPRKAPVSKSAPGSFMPPLTLSVEASLRALIAHESSEYREWGASAACAITGSCWRQ